MNPSDTVGSAATTNTNDDSGSAAARQLVATASSAALSAASAVSSNNILHSPAVLAAQHWPEFHNGVAVGLMISPHASVARALSVFKPGSALNSPFCFPLEDRRNLDCAELQGHRAGTHNRP